VKPAAFKYVRADSIEEALSVLAKYGEDVRVMAGGQSLGALLNMRIVTPPIVLDINRIFVLSQIESGRTVMTGAMVRQADALSSGAIRRDVGLLAQALPHVGHYQTRNRGTLGGSVAHADPSAKFRSCLQRSAAKSSCARSGMSAELRRSNFFGRLS